jgi:hypothetical protein
LIDRGRSAVGAAEERAFGGTELDEPIDRRTAEARLADVTGGPWWRRCGPAVIVARPRASARSSSARGDTDRVEVQLTEPQLSVATVAHELAHALAGVDHGHDDAFRAAYVDVVAVLAGVGPARALSEAFAAMGIAAGERRWPPPHRAVGDGFLVIGA